MVRKIAAVELKSGLFGQLQQALGISVIDNWFDATSFANLADAIASIGFEETTLVISQVIDVGPGQVEVPPNITLQLLQGGSLQLQPGQTVTIQGGIQAGLHQIFYGKGNIKCGLKNCEVYPHWWGAAGDGETNDQEAIQSAVDALDAPNVKAGTVLFSCGRYLVDGGINIPVSIQGLTIKGAGRSEGTLQGTWLIQAGHCPLFTTTGTGSFSFQTFEDISFGQDPSASTHAHIFDLVHHVYFLDIHRVYFHLRDPASSFLRINGQSVAHIRVCDVTGLMVQDPHNDWAKYSKVPAIDISAQAVANLGHLRFENITINSSPTATAPIFRLDGHGSVSIHAKFENVTLEVPGGGGIELRSISQTILENVVSADLNAPTASTVLIGRSTAPDAIAIGSFDIILIGCNLTSGTSTNPDVKVERKPELTDPNQRFSLGPVIISSRIDHLESQDLAPVIMNSGIISNLVGSTTPLWMPATGRIQGVRGISSTAKEPRHLRGSLEVKDGNVSTEQPFTPGLPEVDNKYFLTVTPVSHSQNANIAATRVTKIDKLTDPNDGTSPGFTVHVEAAPGTGESVTFDWHLVR